MLTKCDSQSKIDKIQENAKVLAKQILNENYPDIRREIKTFQAMEQKREFIENLKKEEAQYQQRFGRAERKIPQLPPPSKGRK